LHRITVGSEGEETNGFRTFQVVLYEERRQRKIKALVQSESEWLEGEIEEAIYKLKLELSLPEQNLR